jgi:hypothetical protein
VSKAVLVLPRDGYRGQYDTHKIGLRERDISFLGGHNSLGAVLQRREVSQVAVEDFHVRNVLTYSRPLGFAYPLLDVELLVLGRIDHEDCELM